MVTSAANQGERGYNLAARSAGGICWPHAPQLASQLPLTLSACMIRLLCSNPQGTHRYNHFVYLLQACGFAAARASCMAYAALSTIARVGRQQSLACTYNSQATYLCTYIQPYMLHNCTQVVFSISTIISLIDSIFTGISLCSIYCVHAYTYQHCAFAIV